MVQAMTDGGAAELQTNGASALAVGAADAPSLRSEMERLKAEHDIAQLRAELAAVKRPWWRKGSIVATMTGLIAAMVPITTAVQAYYNKERELSLARSKLENDVRLNYLDRVQKPAERLRTLYFIRSTVDDPNLRFWAGEEIARVQGNMNDLARLIDANPDLDPAKIREAWELRHTPPAAK